MCMKKFDAEKMFFDNLTGFLIFSHFKTTAPSKLWLIVHFVKSVPLRASLNLFSICRSVTDILKMCMKEFDA